MTEYVIYHNPRCNKSRQTLALLEENGIEPEVVLYLEDAPSHDEIAEICELLGMDPIDIVRKKEDLLDELEVDLEELSDAEILDLLEEHPKLIERPIVVRDGEAAVLGRPPENVLDLL